MKESSEKTYPYIRRNQDADYERIWKIWMQDHIIEWMSFTYKDKVAFRETYDRLNKQSDIYVMVDLIGGKEKIVGVRRIKYLAEPYEHVAEFCSMGIHKKYLNRGYGKLFWDKFEDIVRKNPKIKIIRFTQSGGNDRAFKISDSKGYEREALFADWLGRRGHAKSSYYYLVERFSYKIIDPGLLEQSKLLTSQKYSAKLPKLNSDKNDDHLTTQLVENKIQVFKGNQLLLEFDYFPDNSVIQHIGFLENLRVYEQDKSLSQAALRQALNFIFDQNRVRKLELFTHQKDAIQLCQELGFWIRGEKIASIYQGGEYLNELGVEYSFFDIYDAHLLFDSFKQNEAITSQLEKLQQIIDRLEQDKIIDPLGKNYLANLVYQIVRDEILARKLFVSLDDKPWQQVLEQCPTKFKKASIKLQASLIKLREQTREVASSSQIVC